MISLILSSCYSSLLYPSGTLKKCSSSYRNAYVRCVLGKEKVQLNNYFVKVIYSYSHSDGDVILRSNRGTYIDKVGPGNISMDPGTPLTIECTGKKCLISLWVFTAFNTNQFYLVDSAGGVFTLKNETLSETYNCLFDFGEHTRAVFSEITHTRVGTAVSISYYDEAARKIVQIGYDSTEKASVDFNSPGMMEIRDSAYEPISVSAVIGSTQKVKYPFTNHPQTGIVPTTLLNLSLELADKKLLKIAQPTYEQVVWPYLTIAMITISFAILIAGVFILIINTKKYIKKKESKLINENTVSLGSSSV